MKSISTLFFAICSLLLSAASWAEGSVEAGKALYATCATCHGQNGEGNQARKAPRLSHLEPWYLQVQLQKFKNGVRGGAGSSPEAVQMAGMAATLADEQAIADVVVYIASLESEASAVTVEGDARMGGDYFNQFCGACHGPRAEGNESLNSPRLSGSDDWYLVAQLQAFRGGARGSHAEDRTGKQMRAMANLLPNEQAVADVVAFVRSTGN